MLIGESGPDLERRVPRRPACAHTERAATLDDAVGSRRRPRPRALGRGGARPRPATVLLSPAAASFDMFADYAARGRAFKDAVADLVAARARRDR